ncbi:inner membrane-spanning protein YciB [Sphingomonas sp.]|jgi:intracellular septation protein A|uniref:inner membrane-spanning protein YciB n=1 Tax=Sphingomonas sp. TaxID=28214 RepID=UPI002E36B4CA|nr:septation protein IspZ [Sphingomonas sp.]HEX4693396.1 septation protein IspZ [Sphingomonas sp.]
MRQLLYAVVPLIFDSLGVIVFAVLMATHVELIAATVVGAATAIAVVGWELVRRRPVAAVQWLSLVLVIVGATATLVTRDPRFVMAKPTIVYALVGATMMRRGWMNRYVAPEQLAGVEDLMVRFGYVWAALMFLTGATNLIVALVFTAWWPTFLAVFPLASKLLLFGFQFIFVRVIGNLRSQRLAAI